MSESPPLNLLMHEIFDRGNVYLVKGRVDIFWFLLREVSFKFLYKASLNELVETIVSSRFEPADFVIVPSSIKELQQLSALKSVPDEQTRIFLLLSEVDGSLSKEAEKVFKSLSGGCFIQVDLNKYEWKQNELVQSALAHLSPRVKNQLLKDIESPNVLLSLAKSSNPLDYDLADEPGVQVNDLLHCLGTPLSLKLWELSYYDMYRLIAAEGEGVGFYKILAGGGTKMGLCPELWVYLSLFLEMPLDPVYAVRLFVRWVFIATTCLQTSKHKGFVVRAAKGKTFYNFSPSNKAFEMLEQLRSNSFSFYSQNIQ